MNQHDARPAELVPDASLEDGAESLRCRLGSDQAPIVAGWISR